MGNCLNRTMVIAQIVFGFVFLVSFQSNTDLAIAMLLLTTGLYNITKE